MKQHVPIGYSPQLPPLPMSSNAANLSSTATTNHKGGELDCPGCSFKETTQVEKTKQQSPPVTKGITKRSNGTWQVQIWLFGKSRYIGVFKCVELAQDAYYLAVEFCSMKYEFPFMLDCLSPEELKTNMCAKKLHVQNKIRVRHSDALVDNSEICLQRSNVSACGSADTIDNSEIRLQHSNVLACGSADTIDNS